MSYFILNKPEDYIRQDGCLCSRALDSGGKGTQWSRLAVRWKEKKSDGIKIFFFTAEEKESLFSSGEALCLDSGLDCLLTRMAGRYAGVRIVGWDKERMPEDLPEIQIFFQWDSWLDYLPELYREQAGKNDFLFRYLSIFQWIYYDMSQRISAVPHMLYPAYADAELLEWMADWFAMENVTVWNKQQLIYLVENGKRLCGIRGTRQYMEEMVALYTGCSPFIVESYQTQCAQTEIKRAAIMERLYGGNAYVITVILPQGAVSDRQETAVLQQIIRLAAPAYMECRLVVLEPYIFLDRYTYIGLNSCLGSYRNVQLDGNGLTPYISVIGDKQ
ncbi:MAG: hypothetical protein NC300_04150 [Bacteroidales bacterium]|nr:hypothetical protein [Clostridium sp.]MCM1203314.1 hypothetical protein [Bacteroidales bacterium]